MEPTYSVIIPAYNAEKTLERAVNSVLDLENFNCEILIVENGSTDNTQRLSNNLSSRYDNIISLHSSKGVSNARNYGLEHAKGKYILFLDADDYYYDSLKIDLIDFDLICFGHNSEEKAVLFDTVDDYYENNLDDFKCKFLKRPTKNMTVWAKVFKNEVIQKYQLRFNTTLSLSEDSEFLFRYMKYCKSFRYIQSQYYHYSKEDGSTVRSFDPNMLEKYCLSLDVFKQNMFGENDKVVRAFDYYILNQMLLILVHNTFSFKNSKSIHAKRNDLIQITKNDAFNNSIKSITFNDLKDLNMIPIFLIKHHLYLFAILIILTKVYLNEK